MPFTLELTDENSSERTNLFIEGKNIVFDFLPESNSKEDMNAAAIKRDRFNFFIAFFLSPYIEDYISYDNFDINFPFKGLSIQDSEGFCIVLKFKYNVDSNILNIIFNPHYLDEKYTDEFIHTDFDKFISRASRANIIEKYKKYSGQNNGVDSVQVMNNDFQSLLEKTEKEMAELKAEVNIFNQLDEKINKQISNLEKIKQELKPLKCEIIRHEFFDKKGTNNNQLQNDSTQYDERIGALSNKFDEKIQSMQSKLKIDRDHFKNSLKQNNYVLENKPEVNIGLTSKKTISIQDNAKVLLEKNIKRPEKVLIYSTFFNQYEIHKKMKQNKHPNKDIYSDFIQEYPSVFFYNENALKSNEEQSRLDATKKVQALLEAEQEYRRQHKYK